MNEDGPSVDEIREEIRKFIKLKYDIDKSAESFKPGETLVNYSAAVFDHDEVIGMVDSILDGWFGLSKKGHRFEREFSKTIGTDHAVFTNSGSTANLLSIATFFSQQIPDDLKMKAGDEIITPALTFPTTLNPIIQYGLVPVFLDIELGNYNMKIEDLEAAITERTKGLMIPHTLGNPNEMDRIMDIAEDYDLRVIEDSCDALGSQYQGKHLGTFGDFGTFSFYPAHHITTGEGGMVVTSDRRLSDIVQSLRDWGRECVMPSCQPTVCGDRSCPRAEKRRDPIPWELPEDYDKRYTFINIGYNLKPLELQGAMGLEQLKRLPVFIQKRKDNFKKMYSAFEEFSDIFILPKQLEGSDPSWFAFPLTLRENAQFNRKQIIEWYVKKRIEAKVLFSGNITKHPAYRDVNYIAYDALENSTYCMNNSFFLGVYPGLDDEMLEYVISVTKKFISSH